jgi:hypothetical protein
MDELEHLRAECIRLSAEKELALDALNIQPEEVGKILHAGWSKAMLKNGFHGPSSPCKECGALVVLGKPRCEKYQVGLVEWKDVQDELKHIFRHNFDDVLWKMRSSAGIIRGRVSIDGQLESMPR